MTTRTPLAASRSATAAPIPVADPVTIATRCSDGMSEVPLMRRNASHHIASVAVNGMAICDVLTVFSSESPHAWQEASSLSSPRSASLTLLLMLSGIVHPVV